MTVVLLALLSAGLAVTAAVMYLRTSRILSGLDKMLDGASGGGFAESNFDESRLSRIEAKMRRCLSADKAARDKIEGERAAVKALVSDISHQTKTPISNIMLYAGLLGERETDGESRRLLENIEYQTDKLNFLVQALVKTSRLESGVIAAMPRENSVEGLLSRLDFSGPAREKGLRLEIDGAPGMTAVFDMKWTLEALENIVDNAVKYTPSGGKITVTAAKYEMFVRIDVTDTGIGISEDETAKIFARFYRSPEVSDEKGVGIGLYLAREIISRQGGYIKVASEKGRGSVFSVFLPRQSFQK